MALIHPAVKRDASYQNSKTLDLGNSGMETWRYGIECFEFQKIIRIWDYLSPKLAPSPKSNNPNRKLITQNSRDEFVWDETSCYQVPIIPDKTENYRRH